MFDSDEIEQYEPLEPVQAEDMEEQQPDRCQEGVSPSLHQFIGLGTERKVAPNGSENSDDSKEHSEVNWEEEEEHALSSIYVKKLKAPPLAPLLTNLSRSTQSFISLGSGRAFLSRSRVKRIRVSEKKIR